MIRLVMNRKSLTVRFIAKPKSQSRQFLDKRARLSGNKEAEQSEKVGIYFGKQIAVRKPYGCH